MYKSLFKYIFITVMSVFITASVSYGKTLSLNGLTISLDVETIKKSEGLGTNVNETKQYSTTEYETTKKEVDDKKVNVKLTIKNNNSFEKAKVTIESSIPSGFRITGSNNESKETVTIDNSSDKEYSYSYYYRDSFLKDQNNEWEYDENGDLIEDSSNVKYEEISSKNKVSENKNKNYDNAIKNSKDIENDKKRLNNSVTKIIVVVIAFVFAVIILFAVIMVYRSIKGNGGTFGSDDFSAFGLFLLIAILINLIFSQSITFASTYSPQIYEYGKTYTKVISDSVTYDGLNYKFAYKITLEYENTYNPTDEDYENDTDGDGLVDALEYTYMTDKTNVDTDGDAISDYMEVILLDYNPLSVDTFNDGISDKDRDFDNDGLTNSEEITYGTDMSLTDTDYDTLNDYDEINAYGTDPLSIDTDEDALSDADELALGLDPTKMMTDGVTLDSERKIEQTYDMENVPSTLREGDIFIKGISGEVAGIIDDSIKIHTANDSNLENASCVVGNLINIENENDYSLTITLDATKVSDRAGYIVVCKCVDGVLTPIRTTCNDENELTCDITSGTYCLADSDLLLRELNIYNKDYKP